MPVTNLLTLQLHQMTMKLLSTVKTYDQHVYL